MDKSNIIALYLPQNILHIITEYLEEFSVVINKILSIYPIDRDNLNIQLLYNKLIPIIEKGISLLSEDYTYLNGKFHNDIDAYDEVNTIISNLAQEIMKNIGKDIDKIKYNMYQVICDDACDILQELYYDYQPKIKELDIKIRREELSKYIVVPLANLSSEY